MENYTFIVAHSSIFPDSDSIGAILQLCKLQITDNTTKYKVNLVFKHVNELFRVERPASFSPITHVEKIVLCPFAHSFQYS